MVAPMFVEREIAKAVAKERERCAELARSIGGANGEHIAMAIELGAEMTPARQSR